MSPGPLLQRQRPFGSDQGLKCCKFAVHMEFAICTERLQEPNASSGNRKTGAFS